MKTLVAFFRLIRWPNLFFIALTQSLFYYCILRASFQTGYNSLSNILQPVEFWLLSLSSVLIAAAGYIINDYFDLNIDRINKPDRIVIERLIKRRWAIVWHWVLSGTGIMIGFYISWKLRNIFIGPANIFCVVLLWFYSTTFKKKILIGNIIISLLTSWVILVLYLCEFRLHRFVDPVYHHALSMVYKFAILYAAFAFIISLMREVVKDIEDMDGDIRYGCKTMPVVWGINVSKVFIATWLIVLIGSILVIQFYVLQYRWWISVLYCFLFILLPLLQVFRKLYKANVTEDYYRLSQLIKAIMLTGILSMIFFKLYNTWIA
ncbi:MAG: geranylgeranylglycerol-phosphate geranylgeranyltransferase [Bacteroidetes bacterium]|nr:geranylgeranylglycerol-phosphate geranylgeranyltransferase [Bacteroidota bacterium]